MLARKPIHRGCDENFLKNFIEETVDGIEEDDEKPDDNELKAAKISAELVERARNELLIGNADLALSLLESALSKPDLAIWNRFQDWKKERKQQADERARKRIEAAERRQEETNLAALAAIYPVYPAWRLRADLATRNRIQAIGT